MHVNQKQRELLTEILQVWQQLKLPEWDRYDWVCYTTMSNDELQGALESLKLEIHDESRTIHNATNL